MNNNIIVQISEGLGNQLFMYAHAYVLSKELNKNLLIDNTTGYYKRKTSLRAHQKFMLNYFNILNDLAPSHFKYDTLSRDMYKKLLLFIDKFKTNKNFLIEDKKKFNEKKTVKNYSFKDIKLNKNAYIIGNYENEAYFSKFRNDLINIFDPKDNYVNSKNEIISKLKDTNSISIHIRRYRFSDQISLNDNLTSAIKSDNFTNEIVDYINRSVNYINNKINNPYYFIWSNDFENFDHIIRKINIKNYEFVKGNDSINDFYLFKYAKHFIVGPSSFHWWGAWLNENDDKICLRPLNLNPSNNENFWPKNWVAI